MEGATLTKEDAVRSWRVEQFGKLGFTQAVAELFADLHHEIDLNVVRAMRAAGATCEQVEAVML